MFSVPLTLMSQLIFVVGQGHISNSPFICITNSQTWCYVMSDIFMHKIQLDLEFPPARFYPSNLPPWILFP